MNGLHNTAQDWIIACERLDLPVDHMLLGRWERCRVWDEIDRIRSERDSDTAA